MRFFSKKNGESSKITIFTALKQLLGLFVVCANIFSAPRERSYKKRIPTVISNSAYLVLVAILIFCVMVPDVVTSEAAKRGLERGEKKVTHLYPGTAKGALWSGVEEALLPDLDEHALYQKFTAKNSAYVPLRTTSSVEQSAPVIQDGAVSTDVGEVSDVQVETNNEVPAEQSTNVEEAEVEEPVQTESVAETVSLKKAPQAFFAFLGVVGELFPFAQETQVEQIETPVTTNENVTETANANETESSEATNETIQDMLEETESVEGQVSGDDLEVPETVSGVEGATAPQQSDEVLERDGQNVKSISFTDFSLPELSVGESITSVQLRLSLGAQKSRETNENPSLTIVYSNASTSEVIGSVEIEDEVSNALNGGYALFALPEIVSATDFENVRIDLTYNGSVDAIDGLYVDALWFEIETEKIDTELLKEKTQNDIEVQMEEPKLHTLLSEKRDFTKSELPQFSLKYNAQRNVAVRFVRDLLGRDLASVRSVAFIHNDYGDIGVTPKIDITPDGLLGISLTEDDQDRLKPGLYTLEIAVNEGNVVFEDSFSFQWGMLSINSNQTTYALQDTAQISLGALSPNGNTVCDALLNLYIISPTNVVTKTTVEESGLCNGNNVVDVPDYHAVFTPTELGMHEMYLERVDQSGLILSHTSDTFSVVSSLPLTLRREGPSRIYPRATYPMEITVQSQIAWDGVLIERVPGDFILSETDAQVHRVGDAYELRWPISLTAGGVQTVSYTFDAPDISPFIYELGAARLEGETLPAASISPVEQTPQESVVPLENTEGTTTEQGVPVESVTATPVALEPVEVDTGSTISPDVPNLPAEAVDAPSLIETIIDLLPLPFISEPEPEIEQVLVPATEPLETPTVMDQVVGELVTPLPEVPEVPENQNVVAQDATTTASTTQVLALEEPAGTVVFEEHRQWQIASDATGSMIVYWTNGASIPSGWTCLSCGSGTFFQKFVRGGPTYNTTGGAATHNHNASGTVDAATLANSENRTAGGLNNVMNIVHSHTYTPTITASTTLPAYRNLRVIQNNSAGEPATIPAGAVLMFDGALPSGWAQYTALNNRYPRGENTIASLGTSTHRHTISGSTDASSGTTLDGRTGGTQVTAAAENHTHTIASNTGYVNHEPPFISMRFATATVATNTPTSALTLWTDTPPAQWQHMSQSASDPYFNNFTKGSATYGTTGGSETHSHANVTGITSGGAVNTQNARTGATGASSVHTHLVDVTSFTTVNHLPPYVTAIFGKKFGPIPLYTQEKYRWYVNANTVTPTDAWPVGGDALLENEPIDVATTPVKNADVVRLRMQLSVSNSTSTAESFKLQFASTTALCTAASVWTDVGNATSSAQWRGYNNASVADGATLASSTLSGTDVFGSYEEVNPSVTMPNQVGIARQGEWDFVLQQNNASEDTTYCFRMVKNDGTQLYTYSTYPTLVTNQAPNAPTLDRVFDNEKVSSTTPDFRFFVSDPELNDVTYQIQVDDDVNFGSVTIDKNSVTHSAQFENIATPADKDPFTQGEQIEFDNTTALTNGTTYYWRVRAFDPTGSNQYGSWSTVHSFTIDTSVTYSTWFQTTDEQFTTNTRDGVEGFTDQARLKTGSTTGTMYSDPITFSEGLVGTAWGSFTFTDTETSSDLKYTIQYNNGGTWTNLPDSVLAGNSTGFDTSPVSLLGVNKTLYDELRIKATFTNAGASPLLSDWAVSWAYLIETPEITAPFANEKVATTTPTFAFTTTDPQGDSLQYQIQWSTTYAFTASTTRNSNVHPGFTNSSNGGDTDPFNSGDNIRFKIQPANALTNGTTYWWRVRARDPLGSNTYSFFTDPQSFTVDTAVTVSTWFQTTQSQFGNDILSNAFARATDAVTVSTTTQNSLIAYGEGTVTTPRYKLWNGSAWSTEASALDVGASILWTVTKASPVESEYILATMGTDADVNVQVFRNGAWGNLQELTAGISNTSMRGFDVAYEQSSGDALAVSCDGDANPVYWIWNGTSWTNGGAVGLGATATCGWIKLIADPNSDELIVVTRDTTGTGYESMVWNGSTWSNSTTFGSMQSTNLNHEGIGASYEDSGGQAVVAVSNGANGSFLWRAWDGTNWGAAAAAVAIGDDFESGTLVADDGTDNMGLCYIDEDGDIGVMRWTGSAWNTFVTASDEIENIWTTVSGLYNEQPIDCAYEVGGSRDGYLTAVYSDRTNVRYRSFTGTLPWTVEASVSTLDVASRVQVKRTGSNLIHVAVHATSSDSYRFASWNGTTWSTPFETIETNASVNASPYRESYMMSPANPSAFATVVGSPVPSFYLGSGPYWQQFSWTDTTTGGSDILYQVEYYDGNSWELIPNTLIPGNSVGTTTSPINLTGVLPASTYSEIRPVANMSCNVGVCPTLSDWTVTWAAGITISGTAQQYNQSTNVTSGTVGVALNGVVQIGKTGTISGGTWSIANVNATPGDVVTVFVTAATDAAEAVAVTKYDGVGNISGMNLYERHISIGSDDAATITNANLSLYDFTNTEDVFYDVNASNDFFACATTGCGDAELIVKAGNVYQPGGGGDVRTHDFENNGIFRLNGNTMRVEGSWDNNATTTLATSTVHFIATSTSEVLDETGAVSPSFNNLIFGQSTSTALWTLGSTLDINGSLSTNGGTFARGTRTLTLGGNLSNGVNGIWTGIGTTTFDGTASALWTDASVALQNIGKVVIDGTLKTVTLGDDAKAQSLTIGSDDTFDASSAHYDITVFRNWINNNTFNPRQGTVFFAATTTGRIITAGGDSFFDMVFSGVGGAWSFTESVLGVTNDLSITAAGTLTLPTGTTTIAGSFINSAGTFAHNNSLLYFTSGSAETLTFGGTTFTNGLYNVRFTGAGSWAFTEANATTSNLFRITQGAVTLPSNTLTIGDTFTNSAGTFVHNGGQVKFIGSGSKVIDTNSSFNSLRFAGSGSFSFLDSAVTALGSLTVTSGTVTLPSGTLSLGGSLTNSATLAHNNGTVLFNSIDTGESVNLGASALYNMTFSSATGGWTVSTNATTTNNVTLTAANAFTLTSGRVLSVGGVFTNSVGGASTTWTGSTLSLEAGNYSLNTKTNLGDIYNILRVDTDTDIKMWNSSATTYNVNSTGSLYSQDHAGVDGDLYIFGSYGRTSGTEYWSYATDFDGTSLGGSSRQVDVRFASAASASFTNATLNVTGITTASTTVANQGSGTYLVSVSAGTTTAAYYDFRNLGSTGISFSGRMHLQNFSNGFLSPGVGGGTTLTLASTTVGFNPAEQIFDVNFSTTTSIVATNVTQVDAVPTSYWWFRNSRGNIDGEGFDFDSGNPGTVRWDNSSLSVTISGTVYTDEGVTPLTGGTCDGVATPVRVVVEGGASYSGTCSNINGSYSIAGVAIVGDPTVTVYLDGASGGQRAVTVTKTITGDVSGFDLYANHLITRHQDLAPLTIEDMVFDSTNDSDIFFTAATGTTDTLLVAANKSLFIWPSTTFAPGGTLTLRSGGTGTVYDGSLTIGAGALFTASSTSTTTIGGSFIFKTGSQFSHATGTVLMSATTTGKAISVATGTTAVFNTVRFAGAGAGGGWNLSGNIRSQDDIEVAQGTVTGTANITIPNGSFYGAGLVSLGAGTTTIERSNALGGTQGWTFHNLLLGNGATLGTTTPQSVATTTIGGRLTIAAAHFLDAGSGRFDFTGSGTVFVENGTFLEDTSTIRYSGGSATSLRGTSYYNLELNAGAGTPTYTATGIGMVVLGRLSVGGTAATAVNFDTNDTVLDVNGEVLVRSNGTFIGSNSSAFTVGGNWTNSGTFTSSGGTVTFDGAGTTSITPGNSSFGNLTINGAGTFIVSEHATTTSAWNLASAGSFTLASGKTFTVGGVFTNSVGGAATTWTGSTLRLISGTNYQINAKTINDAYAALSVGANTDIRMWNSSAATYTVNASGSLYSQDHNDIAGDLYLYGNYPGNGSTDYWSYATDFDGVALGGGARQVDVRLQGGASADILSGGLQVLGTASASTSIQNQGSGTYGIRIGGNASTTWSYYDVEDMTGSGLTFSGSPTVVNLSRGDFEVTQSGGSAITVGGSVINANTAKTFTNNIFATTTAIAAFNVTATGTSVSSWRFTNHTGNLAGETKDSDPDGDPGYLVWDNSASNITIAGNVYSDEGSTVSTACNGVTNNVHLRVAGLTSYTTFCNAVTGAYSISGITFSPGDSLVVYLDGVAQKAATVTEDPSSNINNLHLYENRVIVRHEGADPLTIADMAMYDSSEDADIPFTAIDSAPDTLTLPANRKLLVWTGKTFSPGGNMTLSGGGGGAAYDGTLEAQTNAVVTFTGTEQHSIGGSFIFGTGATFNAGLSTTTFTTTGSARTIDVNNQAFYNTAFTGSGSWSITDTTFTLRSARLTAGTLTLPSGTTTISGSWDNNGGTFVHNASTFLFTATVSGNQVRGGGSNFEEMIFRGSGGSWSMTDTNATSTSSFTIASGTVSLPSGIFSIGGSLRNVGGTITHNTSEIVMRSATAATIKARGSNLSGLTIAGAGAFTMSDGSLTLVDDFRIRAGSITLATSTLSIGGSFIVTGGTFAHASGTVLFNATSVGKTINPSTSLFHNVVLGSGTGGWTIVSNATTTRNFSLTSAASFTQQSGTRLAVRGVFTNAVGGAATTWTGSTLALSGGTEYAINSKVSGGDNYQTLIIGANTDISSWDSKATTTTVALSSSLYSQDHGAQNGVLNIYGDFHISTTTHYWSYATDFDGTVLGGSPRDVTVSILGGATTTVDGGTLNIVGAATHETTVTNQGSGTYSFAVSDGVFNAQYYEFRNLNASGLNFTGVPAITSLSYGDFELAVSGGSLITLASTTLDANASMLFTGNRFATTTAITGTNITLVGTTSNAWTFSGHTGNLDGESYDNDGASACGSIRWSDSACLLTQQTHYRWRNDDGGLGVPNTQWFNSNWDARKSVRLENVDATTYTNAVVKLEVAYDVDMQTDFDDLRFTDASGTTTLSYFVDRYTASTEADVWVKVPSLSALDTTTIYMYYNNATASSTSSSGNTFIANDDFEDGNRTEYSGDTSLFTVDGTFAYGGSYGIDTTGNESARATDGIARFDETVSQGQIIRYMQYVDGSASGDEACTLFGVQSPVTVNQNYAVCLERYGTDRISLVENAVDTDSSGSLLSTKNVTFDTNPAWYEVEIDWNGSNMFVELSQNGVLLATTSASDSSYTTGGIGFTYWFQNGGWDNYTSRTRVATEPVVRFGSEQADGGASWKAALDTGASYNAGDIARLRLAVENTGTIITGQTYRAEYAVKGAAPSCEAVSGGSYASLPTAGSCGSSPLCMATTTHFSDGVAIADLLSGPEIDFALGEATADPANTADALTLDQNEYTELEYAFTPTVNATAPAYCVRVTNAGDPVDTYLKVAELQLRFDPVVTNVSINGGQPISLLPGATTTVYATGTVTDLNGVGDIIAATSTMYRSGVSGGAACTANNNDCYISGGAPQCTFTNCAGFSCTVSCQADFYYHADATDSSGENWLASIEVVDGNGVIDIGTVPTGVEVMTLHALDVTSTISYGSLAVSSTTVTGTNPATTIENLGNRPIDIDVEGTDLTDGGSSIIPAYEQRFATSTFNYLGCGVACRTLSSTSLTTLEVDLAKPTSFASPVTDAVYWGIEIPFGVASNPHSGTNTFYARGD
jgi:hypothetical protein